MPLSDAEIELFHRTFADHFRKAATKEDALNAQKAFYDRGLSLMEKILRRTRGDEWLDSDDYPVCPHCGKDLLG